MGGRAGSHGPSKLARKAFQNSACSEADATLYHGVYTTDPSRGNSPLYKKVASGRVKAPPPRPMNQNRGTRLGWRKMGSMMLNEHTKSHLCPPYTSQGPQDIHPDLPEAVLKPA